MVSAADLNPLGAARELSKLKNILQLHKAEDAGGQLIGSAAATGQAASRESALMVSKILSKLLNNKVTGPLAMRFLRNNPDICVTLLDLLLQPLVPVVSFAVGKALIGMVAKDETEDAGFQLVRFFPPTWQRVNQAEPAPSKGLGLTDGAAMMRGASAGGMMLMHGGSSGMRLVKRSPRMLSFRRSKSAGASTETVNVQSGESASSGDEAEHDALQGIDETTVSTPRAEGTEGEPTARGAEEAAPAETLSGKAVKCLATTPFAKCMKPKEEVTVIKDSGEKAVEVAGTGKSAKRAAGGDPPKDREEAPKDGEKSKEEGLVTVEFIRRQNVQYKDLAPGRVVTELSVKLSSVGLFKAVGTVGSVGANLGKKGLKAGTGVVGAVGSAAGSTTRTVTSPATPRKSKKTYADGFEAGFIAAQSHHSGPNFSERLGNCLGNTPGLNQCVAKPRDAMTPEELEVERKKEAEKQKEKEKAAEKEWPKEWRDIKQHVIRMAVNLNLRLSLGQLDLSVGGKKWLGKIASGFKLSEAQVAQLRLERVAIKARVRIFWHPKAQKMKIAILKNPPPMLSDLTHELTICSKLMVPPGLIKSTIEKLVLPMLTGRYFDVDLKPPEKKKKGKPGELEINEDTSLPLGRSSSEAVGEGSANAEAIAV